VGEDRFTEFQNALRRFKWDIVGLSEVRRAGENLIKRNGNYFYYFGETKGQKGIGFYSSDETWKKVYEIKGANEDTAT